MTVNKAGYFDRPEAPTARRRVRVTVTAVNILMMAPMKSVTAKPMTAAFCIAALPSQDAATVTELLSHEPDTAGSLMNPEVCVVPPGKTVAEVQEMLRRGPVELLRGYAVAVIGDDERLRGVINFPDLLRADPGRPLEEVMDSDPVTVKPGEPMKEVAETFDRFNLLSVPVVDEEGKFEGIVTVDDVISWLREGEEREGGLT